MFHPQEQRIFDRKDFSSVEKLAESYSFNVSADDGVQKISIDIIETYENFYYSMSHNVSVPGTGIYTTSRKSGDSVAETLELAVTNLMSFYEGAILKGYKSSVNWFIPNKSFRSVE